MDPQTWNETAQALRSTDVSSAVDAAMRLHAECGESDIPRLLELLAQGEDFFVREAAAWPLAELAGPDVLPELLAAYQRGFDEGHDNDGFTAALLEIPALFGDQARQAIVELAARSEPPLKGHAQWLFGFCDAPWFIQAFLPPEVDLEALRVFQPAEQSAQGYARLLIERLGGVHVESANAGALKAVHGVRFHSAWREDRLEWLTPWPALKAGLAQVADASHGYVALFVDAGGAFYAYTDVDGQLYALGRFDEAMETLLLGREFGRAIPPTLQP